MNARQKAAGQPFAIELLYGLHMCMQVVLHIRTGADVSAERVKMPVQMVEVLGQLAAEFEVSEVEAVILPLTPLWCEQNA